MALKTTKPLTRYETMQVYAAKRRAAMQKAMDKAQTTRSAMVSHINNTVSAQVKLTEQILRSKSAVNKKA